MKEAVGLSHEAHWGNSSSLEWIVASQPSPGSAARIQVAHRVMGLGYIFTRRVQKNYPQHFHQPTRRNSRLLFKDQPLALQILFVKAVDCPVQKPDRPKSGWAVTQGLNGWHEPRVGIGFTQTPATDKHAGNMENKNKPTLYKVKFCSSL